METSDFGVGFVAPFGAETHFQLRPREWVGIRLQLIAVRIGNAELVSGSVMFSVGYAAGKRPTDRNPPPAILGEGT
jgi:hypothetical protein